MTTQALLQLSADIITRYYNNEIEPFLAACHPDVLWIGPANTQIIRTRETLIETFAEEHHNLRFEMHDLVTVPLMTPSSKVLEVLLFFDVDTIWPDNSMQRVKQRVQLSWVVEGGQPFIRVCHVSNALDYDDRDVIYPVHYGEDRVRVAVLSGEDRAPRIVLKGANKAMLYLRPAYIDYLETSGMHTYIHTQNDIRESTERLTAIDKALPGTVSALPRKLPCEPRPRDGNHPLSSDAYKRHHFAHPRKEVHDREKATLGDAGEREINFLTVHVVSLTPYGLPATPGYF